MIATAQEAPVKVQTKTFASPTGDDEFFVAVGVSSGESFAQQLQEIERAYRAACEQAGISPGAAIFRRLFVSDILNQRELIQRSPLWSDPLVAHSIIQQAPLGGGKVALVAYHVGGKARRSRIAPRHLLVERNGMKHIWSTGLTATPEEGKTDAALQTSLLFDELIATLKRYRGSLLDNCVRTWLFLKDVDVFYLDMADARKALFESEGLSPDTHYIASTGIGGMGGHQYALVTLEALSIVGLEPFQVTHLNDFSRLSRTIDYNITFERATRVAWRDRGHVYISGTASIDAHGQIVHAGDVSRQLARTVENIGALLEAGGAGLSDLMYAIVYLRDPSDYYNVAAAVERLLPGVPKVCVSGPVCRPGWLIEIEGVAIGRAGDPRCPNF